MHHGVEEVKDVRSNCLRKLHISFLMPLLLDAITSAQEDEPVEEG